MQELVKVIKALSDETRLRILNILLSRDCCVCEVMQALDISQSRASRNLSILQNAGFLKAKRDGTWVVYSLDSSPQNHYVSYLAQLFKDSSVEDETLAKDTRRLQQAKRTGPQAANKGRTAK